MSARLPPARGLDKWLPWVAAAVLAAGVIVFAVVKLTDADSTASEPHRPNPPKTVPFATEARGVAAAFIRTAVARKNLAAAWRLAGAPLKEGTSYRQWLRGDIRVVPYPVGSRVGMRIDYSHPNRAGLTVVLRPRQGVKREEETFVMELRRVGSGDAKRWVVTYWAPKSAGLTP